jgi:hypothetical protein
VFTPIAYLDPGSGSMLVQLAAGGAAALAVSAKLWWRRFLTLFRLRKPDDAPDETA